MKLEIGERYHKDHGDYHEELRIDGLESIDEPLANGEVVVPIDGDSGIEVTVSNSFTDSSFVMTKRLETIITGWESGKAKT